MGLGDVGVYQAGDLNHLFSGTAPETAIVVPKPLELTNVEPVDAVDSLAEQQVHGDNGTAALDKHSRTVFLGGVPVSASIRVVRKSVCDALSMSDAVESVRFRSVPVKSSVVPRMISVATGKLDPKRSSQNAYVVLRKVETVEKLLALTDFKVEGHSIRLDRVLNPEKTYNRRNGVFIGNLAYDIEESDLRALFGVCGPIESIRVIRDKITCAGKGFAYVNFEDSKGVKRALLLSGSTLKDRQVRVTRCRYNEPGSKPEIMDKRKRAKSGANGPNKFRKLDSTITDNAKESYSFSGIQARADDSIGAIKNPKRVQKHRKAPKKTTKKGGKKK